MVSTVDNLNGGFSRRRIISMIRIPEHRIDVGSWDDYEEAIAQTTPRYQAILSVCDQTPQFGGKGSDLYWYPINELGQWGYSVFFWAKRILDYRTRSRDSILIHCAMGAHRSPIILFTWLLSLQVASRAVDMNAINEIMGDDYADIYRSDVRRGTIPGDLERLYELMLEPKMGLTDCLERMARHRAH